MSALAAAELDPALGRLLPGGYTLVERIGQGGMGTVYRAEQSSTGRAVAVKLLNRDVARDPGIARRFEAEGKNLSRLRHPNTLRLFDCARTDDGELFIVTELLRGEPLSALLRREARLPLTRAAHIAGEVCRALSEAHSLGIIHRDLKPDNIFIDRIGTEDIVKVVDFGISRLPEGEERLTRAGRTLGTPLYMAPEQARGEPCLASDIYALGVMLFEMVSGRTPFRGDTIVELLHAHVLEPAPALSSRADVPAWLDRLVAEMLAKAPEERPNTVDAVRVRLAGETLPETIAVLRSVSPPPPETDFTATASPTTVGLARVQPALPSRPRPALGWLCLPLALALWGLAPAPPPPPSLELPALHRVAPFRAQRLRPSPRRPSFSATPAPRAEPPPGERAAEPASRYGFTPVPIRFE